MPIVRHSIIVDLPFKPGDIVWVPFPFVEVPRVRERPALVVSVQSPAARMHLLWVLMITSAANKGWQGDVSLDNNLAECGLNVPCVIRTAKISTIEISQARKSGALTDDLLAQVRAKLALHLA